MSFLSLQGPAEDRRDLGWPPEEDSGQHSGHEATDEPDPSSASLTAEELVELIKFEVK